ncbi:hypothetical protein TNCV_2510931 [Trichonephila clavipes]|nr:hypothetical protein TNCV_2510931 [Trichonephila clavipes]
MRPRIRCSRPKPFFPKLNASSRTTAQTSKGLYPSKLPLWPTCPLHHCRDFVYGPEHKKSGFHNLQDSHERPTLLNYNLSAGQLSIEYSTSLYQGVK